MKLTGTGVKLTYDDFLLFPDDGKRHELIDGEHYVTASPNTKHQRVSGNLYWLLRSYLEVHPSGQLFYAPFDIVFTRFDVVEPDLLYMSNERASEILTSKHVTGSPELVIEIGSPSTRQRDETIKRRLYQRSGVIGVLGRRSRARRRPCRTAAVATVSSVRSSSRSKPAMR